MSNLDNFIEMQKIKRKIWGEDAYTLFRRDRAVVVYEKVAERDICFGDFDGESICVNDEPFMQRENDVVEKGHKYRALKQGFVYVSDAVAGQIESCCRSNFYVMKNGDSVVIRGHGYAERLKIHGLPAGIKVLYKGWLTVEKDIPADENVQLSATDSK